jgi:hypothetical protein
MRHARSQVGMNPDGERLVTYRSPGIMRDGPQAVSFQDWSEADPLPNFDDDVSGFELFSPGCFPEAVTTSRPEDHPRHSPDRHEFEPSFVRIPAPTVPTGEDSSRLGIPQPGPVLPEPISRKSSRVPGARLASTTAPGPTVRKRVKQRWFYEAVPTQIQSSTPRALIMEPCSTVVRAVGASEIPSSASSLLGQACPGLASQDSVHVGSSGTMVLDGGGTGPPALLSRSVRPLRFTGNRGDRFTIRLIYPGGERHSHDCTVLFPEMPVQFLRHNLACLLRVDVAVFLFVGPMWVGLDHEGSITDRVFPGTITPCPYVVQDSEVRVQVGGGPIGTAGPLELMVEVPSLADVRRAVVARAIVSMNTGSVDGGASPYDLVYGLSYSSAVSGVDVLQVENTPNWGEPTTTSISWSCSDPLASF